MTELLVVRAELAACEAKAAELAAAYGAAFALYNHQLDIRNRLRLRVQELERALLESIK